MNMRLILNRSHHHLRFMDFRVGCYEEKCRLLDEIAREHRLRKVFTLVEKQDSSAWRNMGFVREGVYPAFFRTADAYIMSRLYDDQGAALPEPPLVQKTDVEQLPEERPPVAKPDNVRVQWVSDSRRCQSVLDGFNGELRSIPFGRAGHPDLVLHARARAQEGWACAEIDDSFGHAIVGFAPPPSEPRSLMLCIYAGAQLAEALGDKGVSNLFGLCPVDDPWGAQLFGELQFKVTGRLANHLSTASGSTHALAWHRRLPGHH